jgi:hypothetical protein
VHGKQSREFAYGDVISFQQSGAGGYGDPLERDPQRVLEDVLDDYVSVEAARGEYGVVIAGTGADLWVDEAATRRLRTGMTADRSRGSAGDQSHGLPADRSRVAPISGHPRNKPASRPPLP